MEKQPMPPSYNEAVSSQYPSAPLMSGDSPHHVQQNLGWNPNMNQYPQLPVTNQPGYQQYSQPVQAAQQTIVIINQQFQLRDSPVSMICPHCQQQTITRIDFVTSWVTHVFAGVLCILGWCPCAVIPYCTDCLKDCEHKCAKCNGYIGVYRRSEGNRRRF